MVTDFAIIALVPLIALAIGWIYGRHLPDPNSPKGKAYYAGSEWKDGA